MAYGTDDTPHVQYRSPSGDEPPVVDITPMEAYAAAPPAPYKLVPRNGRGKAAITLGCLALVCTGALFVLFPLGIVFAVAAVLFGRSGRDRATWGGSTNGGTATAGLCLGVVALVLGTLWTAATVWVFQTYDTGALRDCVADRSTAADAGHCIIDVLDRG